MTDGGGILVNYVGYPSSIDSLMPDNGIANLAGSLKRAGYPVLVLRHDGHDWAAGAVAVQGPSQVASLSLRHSP